MDKKSIIGLVLIFAIFVGYMWWTAPSKEEIAQRQHIHDSIMAVRLDSIREADSLARVQARIDSLRAAGDTSVAALVQQREDLGAFNAAALGADSLVSISTDRMTVELNTRGGQVNRVVLKGYQTYDSLPLTLITPAEDNMNLVFSTEDNRVVNTRTLHFTPAPSGNWHTADGQLALRGGDSAVVAMRAQLGEGQYLEFAYTFHGDSYEVGYDVRFVGLRDVVRPAPVMDLEWRNSMNRQEKVNSGSRGKRTSSRNGDREKYYSNIYYRMLNEDVENLSMGRDDDKQVKTRLDWVAFKQQYFAAVLNAEGQAFENADLESRANPQNKEKHYLTDMRAVIGIPYDAARPEMHMSFYYGPTKYRDLRAMHRGYDKMLPLGWTVISKSISRWLIIPVFNFLERFNWNYGIIIIIFTLLFRLVMLPLMYKSYQGSAIMRILKPEMDALNKKYPNPEQAMQKQQQMMALQRKAGYSPMAGCLPVLLQMPVWTAMFWFFPIAIELRQKSFLWCDDLSTFDSILDLGFNIPAYGDHVSLFCLLMFGVQFFYTWYTMRGQNLNQGVPGMKFMMYFMPFMMLFIFNSQSAGLNIYQLVSISFTMVTMILIRQFTSERRVRARMAAYDQKHASAKPGKAKKSKFQQRLEEMQKMAEQMQKEQNRRK